MPGSVPGILSQNFDSLVYESLPHFKDASHTFHNLPARDQIIRNARKTFAEFGVSDIVGLSLNHKHFDIPGGTVLCEEQFVNKSIIKPTSLDKISAMVPGSFALRDGIWEPYEFVVHHPKAKERLEKLAANERFLLKIKELVDSLGLSDLLGLKIINRDYIPTKHTMESRGEKCDELVVVPKTPEQETEGSLPVYWMDNGVGECGEKCSDDTSSDCGHQ